MTKSSSSSSFSGFSPLMPVPLGQLHSSTGFSVLTMSPSATAVCAVTYSVTGLAISVALFVPPSAATPVKPCGKRCHVEDPRERKGMLAEFEDI